MSRPSLREFRHEVFELLDDLERLAADGYAELQTSGSTMRRFRRRQVS
jgi:hypothetical protein